MASDYKEPFTYLPNQMLQAKMSTDALALIVYLNSLPKNWIVYRKQLMEHFHLSRDRVNSAFNELKNLGYLSVVPERDPKGKVKEWITRWSKVPEFNSEKAVDNLGLPYKENTLESTDSGHLIQNTGFPHSGEPTIWKNDTYKENNNYKEIILNKTTTETDVESPVVVGLIAKMKRESINVKTTLAWIKRYGIEVVLEKVQMLEGVKPSLRKTAAHWMAAALRDDYKDDSKITKKDTWKQEFEKSKDIISKVDNMPMLAAKEMPLEAKMLFDNIVGRGKKK
jgi:hypothetical protein